MKFSFVFVQWQIGKCYSKVLLVKSINDRSCTNEESLTRAGSPLHNLTWLVGEKDMRWWNVRAFDRRHTTIVFNLLLQNRKIRRNHAELFEVDARRVPIDFHCRLTRRLR